VHITLDSGEIERLKAANSARHAGQDLQAVERSMLSYLLKRLADQPRVPREFTFDRGFSRFPGLRCTIIPSRPA